MAKKGDATAKRLIRADLEHHRTVDAIERQLVRRNIVFDEITARNLTSAAKRQLSLSDFVISIGGDGTALGASHFVREGMMIGVNSAPGDSVGHFCSVNRVNFAERLDSILEKKWRPTSLARLELTLDGKILPELALNDALIAHDCPASTTRYLIAVDGNEEEHRSSGIWISTAAGSTAGIRSAGGKKISLRSQRIQYLVRELYREPAKSYHLTRGPIDPGKSIIIASKMPDGELYIDGARTIYAFPFGARVSIKIADRNLNLFL